MKLFDKIKAWWENPAWPEPWWTIRAYILQPIVPVKHLDYVLEHNGTWSAGDMLTDKYCEYWVGDFKKGKAVKVRSIEVVRHAYCAEKCKTYDLEDQLNAEKEKCQRYKNLCNIYKERDAHNPLHYNKNYDIIYI